MGNVHSTNQTAVWSRWKPVFNMEKMRYLISVYNTKSHLYRITSFLPYDFFMPFHLFILNFQQILFLKFKSSVYSAIFSHAGQIHWIISWIIHRAKKQLGHSYDIWRQWQLLTFLLWHCKSRLQQESQGLSREDRNEPLCFALCSRAENIVKISKAYYNDDKIFCCRGFLILLRFTVIPLSWHKFGVFCVFWA